MWLISFPGTNTQFCTMFLGIDDDDECKAAVNSIGSGELTKELTNRRAESEMGIGMFIISTKKTSFSLSVRRKLH